MPMRYSAAMPEPTVALERLADLVNADPALDLLTGEYDFSCTPEDTLRTAPAIPGARVTIMKGLGHFAMSEDPARFRQYLLPVLDEIRARQA